MPQTINIADAQSQPDVWPTGQLQGIFKLKDRDEYIENPYVTDYHEGDGPQVQGGTIYNAEGIAIGHADPTGHRGAAGHPGSSEPTRIVGVKHQGSRGIHPKVGGDPLLLTERRKIFAMSRQATFKGIAPIDPKVVTRANRLRAATDAALLDKMKSMLNDLG
jgi:hypothetical protein